MKTNYSHQNNKNYEIYRITKDNNENHYNLSIPRKNHENHEISYNSTPE